MQISLASVTTKPCEATSTEHFADRIFGLTPSASSTAITEGKDNVFQMCFADPNQGLASADYIADQKLGTKVAVIYRNDDVYSSGIYENKLVHLVARSKENAHTTSERVSEKNWALDVLLAGKFLDKRGVFFHAPHSRRLVATAKAREIYIIDLETGRELSFDALQRGVVAAPAVHKNHWHSFTLYGVEKLRAAYIYGLLHLSNLQTF